MVSYRIRFLIPLPYTATPAIRTLVEPTPQANHFQKAAPVDTIKVLQLTSITPAAIKIDPAEAKINHFRKNFCLLSSSRKR
jgi:hypothetical protein